MSVVVSPAAAVRGARVLDGAFYGGCVVLLVVLVLHRQDAVLPPGLGRRLGHNSEVFALALALGLVIDVAHPRWTRLRSPLAPAVAAGIGLGLFATWLLAAGLPPTLTTLNEPLYATAVLTALLGLRRPLVQPWRYPAFLLVLTLLGSQVAPVRAQAEAVTGVLAALVSFELVDRSVLQPGHPSSRWLWPWLGFLALWPAAMLALDDRGVAGTVGGLVAYQARGAEGFWGVLLLHGFLVLRGSATRGIGGRSLRAAGRGHEGSTDPVLDPDLGRPSH
jgi:hypothetical protein